MDKTTTFQPGLNGVIAAETKLSYLDVEAEEIVIRGYDLIELAEKRQYIDLIQLLLKGRLPDGAEQQELEETLKLEAPLSDSLVQLLAKLPKDTHPMDALRTGISALAGYDKNLGERKNLEQTILRLLAKIPVITAGSYHLLQEKSILEPDPDLSYSANFLYMLTGRVPDEQEASIFDQSLMVYSEHEMPNSTFTARVIASTNSDLYGALTGAVASLKGNLHGGANEAVMHMLLEGRSVEGFRQLLLEKLARKEKVMGFGHRVYMRKMDPRASLMKEALRKLAAVKNREDLLECCEAGEELMKEEKGLYPNLDYYAAPVYYLLGIPIDLYTPIFFSARTLGICAHVAEQYTDNKLFRPRVHYTGPRGLHP
ncbi:citrate synthase [Halobacillus kuroshimensis]|uniref:Citrate synthase n=1 Tax=Halobacillus kuroshimensis TaxID=302481 RepID=A0ABS3DWH9_9BACI|nr:MULTISPECIES: citrate synthase [Halobacillus]MBN8235697.1 citrate synthase [Halobacillus kuroshimensis]